MLQVLGLSPTRRSRELEIHVLDDSGDSHHIWDPDVPVEVEQAQQLFNNFKAKGYLAYKVDRKGNKGEVLKSFDPDAEKMILAPPQAGG